MKITELAIKKPAAMTMVIMFFIVMGLVGYMRLGSDLFPETNTPFISVVTRYPGAGAKEIESQVVEPIEEAVSSLPGIKRTTTTATEGLAVTILEFTMSTDADIAAIDVQKAVDAVQHRLPRDAEKPVVHKHNMNEEPVMTLVLSGERPLTSIHTLAKDTVKQQLESVQGVGAVTLVGGLERVIDVQVDRTRMEGYGLSINQIVDRLSLENVNMPAGSLKQPATDFTVRLLGEYKSLPELEEIRIPFPGGSVALRDIASVKDSYAEATQYARFDGRQAVALIIQKQNDASIIEASDAVSRQTDAIKKQLPKDVELVVAQNNSDFIRSSLADSKRTLLEGVLMTGIVLIFFLREWRSVFTVMLAIPTSIISTFLMMYFAGFTFNILSLMGLTLCVGILVDDSIVILENIHRHRTMGKDPEQAAIDGRYEIGMAAVAITLQDVVVFMPIAFMTGLVGQFFRQFGLTVVFAALFSLFVSFTLTPMLSAKLGKKEGGPAANLLESVPLFKRLYSHSSNIAGNAAQSYRRLLIWALDNRKKVFAATAAALVLSVALIPLGAIGSEFIPNPDQSTFTVNIELPPGTPLLKTDELVKQMEDRLKKMPEVEHYLSMPGRSSDLFAMGSNNAQIVVTLRPKNERKRTLWQVADEIRNWKRDFPGVKLTVTEAGLVGTQELGPPIQVEIVGHDEKTLSSLSQKVQEIVEKTPGAVDVKSSWKASGQPEVQVTVDRLRASAYGLSAAEIAQAMRASIAGETAARYREEGKEYDIRVRLNRVNLASVADVGEIKVSNAAGLAVPLKQVANISVGSGPTTISHLNRERLVVISANTKGRPLGDITRDVDAAISGLNVPEGYRIQYYGAQKNMEETFGDLIKALILAVILVYMILVVLYESFLTPLVRMLSLPCGAIGALLALCVTGNTFNIISLIGLVMLDGLAAKSGTLLIDYTNTLMKRGLTLREALIEAGTTRLRPIVMTASTMVGGMLPTALALAEGSEIRKSMAVVIIGGLATTTLLTPVLIPVAYTLLEDFKEWFPVKWQALKNSILSNISRRLNKKAG
ncbi:MAG TPA: efflux RND transporter permease subunit [Bacillota bacterium]|nr:efflux RND transporter permease subunit [Bacillota bacterium]